MGSINWGRVIGGGLAAGLVMNIGQTVLNVAVLAKDSEEAMKRLNLEPAGGGAIGIFVLETFVIGILIVWLYAAMRPRYGAGPKTAALAGLAVWFLSRLVPSVGYGAMGMFPVGLLFIAGVWGLIEVILAALVGGWLYKEA